MAKSTMRDPQQNTPQRKMWAHLSTLISRVFSCGVICLFLYYGWDQLKYYIWIDIKYRDMYFEEFNIQINKHV